MGLFSLFKPARTVLVVDVVSLNEAIGQKGKIPPRNQLQMLRRLARFAQREKLGVIAVLSGTPLNKAPAGKKFEEITVLYSASMDDHAKYLAKTVRSEGAGAVLISGNVAAEKLVGSQVKKMRVSTFRKVFDTGGDDGGNDRAEGGNGNRSRGNRLQRRRQKKNNSGDNNTNNCKPKAERKPKENKSEADAINELIDLVD
ncbi:hypothetical protein EGM51_08700 [Verrucomicrobia bacterium S94]|nr:hypothetical protein EGM51_08700 [Verrucomicrobia bacterium S94]